MAKKTPIETTAKDSAAFSDEFLLQVILSLGHSTEKETSQTEQRVTFFLSITAVAISGLAIIVQFGRLSDEQSYLAVLLTLFVLLLYGVSTLHRTTAQVVHSRINARLVQDALERLSRGRPGIREHAELRRRIDSAMQSTGRYRKDIRGTLAEFMYLTNSLLVSAIAGTLAWDVCRSVCFTVEAAVLSSVLAGFGFYKYAQWMKKVIDVSRI